MIEVAFKYMSKQPIPKAIGRTAVASFRGGITWSKAFDKLRYELAKIGASDVIIEAGYKPEQVRADGWPYQNARPEHGQVRISFTVDKTPMSFFCGGWTDTAYNAHMIAMTLYRLRAVDRYGCIQGGEQYRGWAQLPQAIVAEEWPSVEAAVRFLATTAEWIAQPAVPANIDAVYRDAAKKAHPDAGGSNELMSKVNRARDFIAAHVDPQARTRAERGARGAA